METEPVPEGESAMVAAASASSSVTRQSMDRPCATAVAAGRSADCTDAEDQPSCSDAAALSAASPSSETLDGGPAEAQPERPVGLLEPVAGPDDGAVALEQALVEPGHVQLDARSHPWEAHHATARLVPLEHRLTGHPACGSGRRAAAERSRMGARYVVAVSDRLVADGLVDHRAGDDDLLLGRQQGLPQRLGRGSRASPAGCPAGRTPWTGWTR